MDVRRLIKKSEKSVRKKIYPVPSPAEATEIPEIQDIPEPVIEPTPPAYIEVFQSDHVREYYRPLRSVGNSGWQPSDVWRDIRVDDFCE
ncbi:hypothetical protein WKK05_39325 (plasmid) [Nostoc sp. UHCC 0302]|uniref:hypothetical protein n=1 Tax=Nostoc sp. UHCC 0302 TaxID=3134896 RepID=UPI00311CC7D8